DKPGHDDAEKWFPHDQEPLRIGIHGSCEFVTEQESPMTIDPRDAAASLQHVAAVEQRTREAMFYAGSSVIFILWGLLVACGYGLTELAPRSAGITWLLVSAVGCGATALIIAVRMRTRSCENRDWRLVWAMVTLSIYGAAWSYVLGPVVPRPVLYAFQ